MGATIRSRLFVGCARFGGGVPIAGGSALGAITHEWIEYSGYSCVVAAFSRDLPILKILSVENAVGGETQAGVRLGEQIREIAPSGSSVILFFDSVAPVSPPALFVGSRLVEGLAPILADCSISLIGAGLLGDFQASDSFVLDGTGVRRALVTAARFSSVGPVSYHYHARLLPSDAFLGDHAH